MTTAYALASGSPFCEAHARVDELIKQLTSPDAMRAPLGDIERLLAKEIVEARNVHLRAA